MKSNDFCDGFKRPRLFSLFSVLNIVVNFFQFQPECINFKASDIKLRLLAGGVYYEHEDEKGCNTKIPFTYISQFSGESSQKSTTFFFPSYSLSMLEHAGFLLQEKKVYKHVGLFASFFVQSIYMNP